PEESEAFATKLTDLVMPVPHDRIPQLRHLRERYDASAPPPPDYGVSLGAVGALGVFLMIGALLAGALSPVRVGERLRVVSILGVLSILVIVVGGLSSLIAYVLSPQLRAW